MKFLKRQEYISTRSRLTKTYTDKSFKKMGCQSIDKNINSKKIWFGLYSGLPAKLSKYILYKFQPKNKKINC